MLNVSVIIPTFNGLSLLKKNLSSVLYSLQTGDELVIADDQSQDETATYLIEKYDLKPAEAVMGSIANKHLKVWTANHKQQNNLIKVKLLLSQKNQRFAQNVNNAVDYCTHELMFILNNDAQVKNDTIKCLVDTYQKLREKGNIVFAIGCLEYEGQNNQAPKAGKNVLFFEKGMFFHRKASDFDSGATAWVSGGSGLFVKSLWEKLHGFDPNYYPAYWEDVDLSFRARKAGYLVWFEASAVVYHLHESTNAEVFSQSEIIQDSLKHQTYFTWKNGNVWQKIAFLLWRPYWLIKYQSYKSYD